MKKILIVDDSKVVRKFMAKCLIDLGFTDLTEAVDGKEALNIVKETMPEVIILDWNMQVVTCLEFITELRKLPNGNYPVIIFCSTDIETRKVQIAICNTVNEYIMKPIDVDILKTKLIQMGVMD